MFTINRSIYYTIFYFNYRKNLEYGDDGSEFITSGSDTRPPAHQLLICTWDNLGDGGGS